MEKAKLSLLETKVTYIHNPDEPKYKNTWNWLEEIVKSGNTEKIPPVILVRDPDSSELMVYDGNTRVAYAKEHNIELKSEVIFSQEELDFYLREHIPSWFGIKDFNQLLEFMRYYAAHPRGDSSLPQELQDKLQDTLRVLSLLKAQRGPRTCGRGVGMA